MRSPSSAQIRFRQATALMSCLLLAILSTSCGGGSSALLPSAPEPALSLSASTLIAGTPNQIQGTLTLSRPAPPTGLSVRVSVSSGNVVLSQNVLSFAAGQSSATFTLAAPKSVSAAEDVQVKAGDSPSSSAVIQLLPQIAKATIESVTVSPGALLGGNGESATALVTLSSPAPVEGVDVSISVSSPSLALSTNVLHLPEGVTTGTFNVRAPYPALQNETVDLIVTSADTKQATVTILPQDTESEVASLILSPTALTAQQGSYSVGTVTLRSPAPDTGLDVSLATASQSLVQIPKSVHVEPGQLSVQFRVYTLSTVTQEQPATITAILDGSRTGSLVLLPPRAIGTRLSQNSVIGGSSTPVNGFVTLNTWVPYRYPIKLYSTNPSLASVPPICFVEPNTRTASFQVKHFPVFTPTQVYIYIEAGNELKLLNLIIRK